MTPEAVPAVAATVFAESLPQARRFADLLASAGVQRGLLGPREPERLWTRHLLNCAVVTELLPHAARVVDVGSGAGLPGLAMAIRRPDLCVDLVEPTLRRVDFLTEAVAVLGVGSRVRVVRGRAEERAVVEEVGAAGWVTARAVAPLDRLVGWCLPLLRVGGTLLALKGSRAGEEVRHHGSALARAGAVRPRVVECGQGLIEPATTVVLLERGDRRERATRTR